MRRPVLLLISLGAIFLLPRWAAGQNKYEPNSVSIIEAIARGEAREALSSLEAQGAEAEKNAASSPSPQRYWEEASNANREAARAASILG